MQERTANKGMVTVSNLESMTEAERLDLIRQTLYSSKGLSERFLEIMLIADPGAAGDMVRFMDMRQAGAV